MEKLKNIKIGGVNYPLKCDLNVLQNLQEVFGSVSEFERDLLGVRFLKNDDGTQVYTPEGDPAITLVEPSIKAIKYALLFMINEGLEYYAHEKGKEYEPIEDMDIITKCDIDFNVLKNVLHDEYKKCFVTKKS